MKDLYLLDGYNIIFGLPEMFSRNDLESDRRILIDYMQDYGAHNDVEIIIVFDGQNNSDKVQLISVSKDCHIVFTPARMTADSYIEKESYLRRDEYRSVYVVTSDGPQQSQILGNGAYRMAVSDWVRMLREDKGRQEAFLRAHHLAQGRSEIEKRIPSYVKDKLNTLRKGGESGTGET